MNAEPFESRLRALHLDLGQRDRLPGLGDEQLDEFVGALRDGGGDFVQQVRAVDRGLMPRFFERRRREIQRLGDFLSAGHADFGHQVPVVGIAHFGRLVRCHGAAP